MYFLAEVVVSSVKFDLKISTSDNLKYLSTARY